MRPDERTAAYLWDMRRYAERAHSLVLDITAEEFANDPVLRLAAERAVEIIGEAARHVSSEFRAAHPQVAWRQIIGLRNILVHQYAEVNVETLWTVVSEYAPALMRDLDALIPMPPSDPV